MSVQWFPGHMTKAIRLIEETLPSIDMIIECRDARIVNASMNPLIRDFIPHKPRLIVLTKKDLADRKTTQKWMEVLENNQQLVIAVDNHKDNVRKLISSKVMEAMQPVFQKQLRRGIKPRKIRAMIMGVPNVGKSTIVNRLASRKVVDVQNRPGVTMSLTKIAISKDLEIVDSPGLLWPKFESQEQGIVLALCASIKTTGFDMNLVVKYGIERLLEINPMALFQRYKVEFDSFEALLSSLVHLHQQSHEEVLKRIYQDIIQHQFGPISWEKYHEQTV